MRNVRRNVLLSCVLVAAIALLASAAYAQDAPAPDGGGRAVGGKVDAPGDTPPKPAGDAETGAEGEGAGEGEGEQPPAGKGSGWGGMTPLLLLAPILLIFLWSGRGRKKQEAKRKQMLSELKKGDKVTSIGGIVGTVIEVREDELVIKVDESSNTRMRFARWAIRGIGEEAKKDEQDQRR